jgi:RNA polymerase sigma factor (sigma-70 family)
MSVAAKIAVENTPQMRLFVGPPNNSLVEDNLGLAKSIVSKFCRGIRPDDSDLYPVACLELIRAATTFDPSKAKFSTWATRLITHRLISETRKRKKDDLTVLLSSLDRNTQERSLADNDECECEFPIHLVPSILEGDCSECEAENKRILLSHYLEGKSFSEIAKKMGLSREAVRMKAKKAILLIRREKMELLKEYL